VCKHIRNGTLSPISHLFSLSIYIPHLHAQVSVFNSFPGVLYTATAVDNVTIEQHDMNSQEKSVAQTIHERPNLEYFNPVKLIHKKTAHIPVLGADYLGRIQKMELLLKWPVRRKRLCAMVCCTEPL